MESAPPRRRSAGATLSQSTRLKRRCFDASKGRPVERTLLMEYFRSSAEWAQLHPVRSDRRLPVTPDHFVNSGTYSAARPGHYGLCGGECFRTCHIATRIVRPRRCLPEAESARREDSVISMRSDEVHDLLDRDAEFIVAHHGDPFVREKAL